MSTSNASVVGMLPAAEGVQLIIDAQYNYANPLAGAPLFTIVPKVSATSTYKVARLKKASYSARPISGACDQSAFNQGNKGTVGDMEFSGQLYDQSGDLCLKDFENLCNAWTNGQISIALRPGSIFAQNEILAAIFANKLSTMRDDLARIVWFARKAGFVVNTAADSAPFYVSALPTGASEMLGGKQDGMWAIMVANTALAVNPTPYVDTNDGSVGGNALNPANIYQYLQRMVDAASPELRGMSKIGENAPFFVLDYSMYEAYRQYLIQNGSNAQNALAWQFQQNAQEVLVFNGYKVFMDMDADKFDREMGATTTSTIGGKPVYHSRNARAIFTAPKNMFIGLDLETGVDNIGLIVESGTSAVRDAGKTFYKMMMSVGMGILDPLMQVVGYPSETGTFQ